MTEWQGTQSTGAEGLIARIRQRAFNLYQSRQLLCTEAVLVALNHGLGGGLTENQAVAMAAPFCAALGESGCLCGALSGAVLASGLFLGGDRAHHHRQEMRHSALALHNAFRTAHGATCCRVLIRQVRHDKKAHFQKCAGLTGHAAETASRLILYKRPGLARQADNAYLLKRQSKLQGLMLTLMKYMNLYQPRRRT